jgi:hypothetical protein
MGEGVAHAGSHHAVGIIVDGSELLYSLGRSPTLAIYRIELGLTSVSAGLFRVADQ